MKTYICELCGQPHAGQYGSGRFCSEHCRRVWIGRHSAHNGNHKNNLNLVNLAKKAKYGTWKCHKCGLIFETRSMRKKHNEEFHKHEAWNKGLTAETSQSVQKGKTTLKRHIDNGTYVPKRIAHTKKTKEKLSIARMKFAQEYGGFSHIKWYKVKNLSGEEFTVRGHWEENIAKRLNEIGYVWTKNKWITYISNDGITRHYNPDFYIPSLNAYIEVKGYYKQSDKIKMRYVLEQNSNITIFFLHGQDYKDFIDKKIDLRQDLIMNLSDKKFW